MQNKDQTLQSSQVGKDHRKQASYWIVIQFFSQTCSRGTMGRTKECNIVPDEINGKIFYKLCEKQIKHV